MAVPRVLCGISSLLTDLIDCTPEKEPLSPPGTAVPWRVWCAECALSSHCWGTAQSVPRPVCDALCDHIDICLSLLPALAPAPRRGLLLPFSCTSQLRQNGGSGGMNHYHSLSLLKSERIVLFFFVKNYNFDDRKKSAYPMLKGRFFYYYFIFFFSEHTGAMVFISLLKCKCSCTLHCDVLP